MSYKYKSDPDFIEAVEFTLLQEGVISDDPHDTGGYTIFGISYKWFPEQVKHLKKLLEEGNIEGAIEFTKEFYYNAFWLRAGCDKVYRNLALCIFDTAVNCGISRAKKIRDKSDDSWRIYLLERCDWNTQCKTEKYHLRGWTKRIIRLKRYIEESI